MDFRSIIFLFLKIELVALVIKVSLLFMQLRGKGLNEPLLLLEKVIDIITFPFQKPVDLLMDFVDFLHEHKTIEAIVLFICLGLSLILGSEKMSIIFLMIGTFIAIIINSIVWLYERNKVQEGEKA